MRLSPVQSKRGTEQAANEFEAILEWLLRMPKLAWLAMAGNPCAAFPELPAKWMTEIAWQDLALKEKVGEGASGEIYRAQWKCSEQPVAVKLFKNALTSDGLPESEMRACEYAGSHAHLIATHGRVLKHPEGRQGNNGTG